MPTTAVPSSPASRRCSATPTTASASTGLRGADGEELTTADLDECHGTTSEIMWEGELVEMDHYVATREFPYTVGCFRGTPMQTTRSG